MAIAIYLAMLVGIIAFSTIITGNGLTIKKGSVDILALALGTLAFIIGIFFQIILKLPQIYAPTIALIFSVLVGIPYRNYKKVSIKEPDEDLYEEGMRFVASVFETREESPKTKFSKPEKVPKQVSYNSEEAEIEIHEEGSEIVLPFYEGTVKKPLDSNSDFNKLKRLKEIEKYWEDKE